MKELFIDRISSPIGTVTIICDGTSLCALDFDEPNDCILRSLRQRFGAFKFREASNPLGLGDRVRAYFAGSLRALDAAAIDTGGTPFQRRVWDVLRTIPPGRTMSYGAIAAQLDMKQASRAVGLANGSNPISIVVPCHRVIGSDGSLTGYGGGIERKRWLLQHEGVAVAG